MTLPPHAYTVCCNTPDLKVFHSVPSLAQVHSILLTRTRFFQRNFKASIEQQGNNATTQRAAHQDQTHMVNLSEAVSDFPNKCVVHTEFCSWFVTEWKPWEESTTSPLVGKYKWSSFGRLTYLFEDKLRTTFHLLQSQFRPSHYFDIDFTATNRYKIKLQLEYSPFHPFPSPSGTLSSQYCIFNHSHLSLLCQKFRF